MKTLTFIDKDGNPYEVPSVITDELAHETIERCIPPDSLTIAQLLYTQFRRGRGLSPENALIKMYESLLQGAIK